MLGAEWVERATRRSAPVLPLRRQCCSASPALSVCGGASLYAGQDTRGASALLRRGGAGKEESLGRAVRLVRM